MKKIIVIFVLSITFGVTAQELKKAEHLYKNRAYAEAIPFYLKVTQKKEQSLKELGDCYYFTSNMVEAVKWYKAYTTQFPNDIPAEYCYRYSQALYGVNNVDEGLIWYNKYNKLTTSLPYNNSEINTKYNTLKLKKTPYLLKKITANTNLSEYGGAFYGDKLVYTRTAKKGKLYGWNKESYLDLYIATVNKEGELEESAPFSSEINSQWHEGNAVFTKDGNTIYFTASNIKEGKKFLGDDKINHLKIYKAVKVNDVWTNVKELPFNDDYFSTEHPALNEDETKLYFASDRPGSYGSFDLYVVDILKEDSYSEPKNLGKTVNTEKREQFPFVNKNTLYFASNGHLGLGGLDIFKSTIKNNSFTKPENLYPEINSQLDDFAYVLNDSLSIGYISSNRDGSDDIYRFTKERETQIIPVEIRDAKTKTLISDATVALFVNNKSTLEQKTINGKTTLKTPYNPYKTYKINASHQHYNPKEITLTLNEELRKNTNTIIYLDSYVVVEEKIVEKNNKIQIDHEPILFDLNSSYLTKKATIILDDVVAVLNKYPNIVIRCESHTDSRESDKYNQWLSDRRAKRTADYIISKGISASRITKEGFGEKQLLNECSSGVPCSEVKHQLNRRTEFVLISK